MVKPVDLWVKKQIARVSVALDDYKAGVQAVTEAPTAKAAEKRDKWLANIQAKADFWERRLRAVSLDEWKKDTLEKADRFSDGVAKAEDKIRRFVAAWQPILAEIQRAVRAMPDRTDADRERRMLENLRRLKRAKGTWLR